MISKDELMRLAGKQKLNPSSLGKDYALGWLLFGISKSSVAEKLVFKGGTAISKIYFPENWRLSEDLDFTITDAKNDFKLIMNALENEVPKIIQNENNMNVVLKDRPHTNVGYLQSRLQYIGPLGKDTVKIEISKDVIGKFKIEKVPRVFDYPDFEVPVYSLEDIVAEKMRSIIQRTRIRDYYDVWRLLKVHKFNNKSVKELFLKKCESKKVQFTGVDQFFPANIAHTLEPYMKTGLTRLSRAPLPPLKTILKELKTSLNKFLK
ncbi:MAG: nucleotidyl transferase AbiEii/AbiGii toxin family protein [Nitrosopumilaceae archaeon]